MDMSAQVTCRHTIYLLLRLGQPLAYHGYSTQYFGSFGGTRLNPALKKAVKIHRCDRIQPTHVTVSAHDDDSEMTRVGPKE